MGLTNLFTYPFYTGVALAPAPTSPRFIVYLAGHGYLLDLSHELTYSVRMKHESIPLTANQININPGPGENTINQEDLWRRTQESWHLGAGQVYADREDSVTFRFNSSQGVDPWTRWQLSLLHDTSHSLTSSSTNLLLTVAGSRIYVTDAHVLKYSTDLTNWSSTTGNPAADATSVCSDGTNIYCAYGTNGIYLSNNTGTVQASWITGTANTVRYVKSRLMVASGPSVYNVTTGTGTAGPTALPSALWTHNNPSFTFVDFAEGPDFIYAAGYSGDKSVIYKIAITADGTALAAGVVAGELPDGEIVRSLQGYLGFLMIGTDLGVRVAQMSSSGALTVGPLITTDNAVAAFEPQDRFCWYGLTNFTGTSTGLGRLDLQVEALPGQPAYASDLMVTAQGAVQSAATFLSKRVFTVSGSGVWNEATTYVTSGSLLTGLIGYGISENKTAIQVQTESAGLPASTSYQVALASNGGTAVNIGNEDVADSTTATFVAGEIRGRRFELTVTLAGGANSPTFYRATLLADPTAALNESLFIPLAIHENLSTPDGVTVGMDVVAELSFVKSLRESRAIVGYQEGMTVYTGVVKDYVWYPYEPSLRGEGFNGTCYIEFKTIP